MEKLFIPYELALKLKELGFDEDYLGVWMKDGSLVIKGEQLDDDIKAPLWQQAFDWCLEILNQSYALHACFYDGDNDCMIMEDFYRDSPKVLIDSTKEECLEKLIELCEKNQ